jgi:adenosine 3'-phospho 5'-phosphosulfate transporter B3
MLNIDSSKTRKNQSSDNDSLLASTNEMASINILCYDLSGFSQKSLFIVLTILTFVFFLLYGYLQELLYQLPGFANFSWFLTLIQFFFYSCFAFIEALVRNDLNRKIPINSYFLLAFLTVGTMGLSNASLPYLNYPTQVMFKCCKLIPVLIGGILIQGKKFNIYDVSASLFMSIGLIFFTLADYKIQPTFQPIGIALISLALCADAAIGNVQEKQMKKYKASNIEMVGLRFFVSFKLAFASLRKSLFFVF